MPTNEADIRNAALEEAAKAAEHWGDRDSIGVRIAAGIRALKSAPAPVPEPKPKPKPFTFADPARQLEHERHKEEGLRNKRGER
ncbi:hypothetical protein [Rhizobium redzepovicii]|uniref:hypothetical protein n=1 Tax=Rhizobium redzepovicii TaxID=2867518 RepID=UPI002870CF5B|nr:hypothetical protein [Rhizobium redzepovicii]MDR9781638.1 hypothetical protein [Rhizobium redzepovicii]